MRSGIRLKKGYLNLPGWVAFSRYSEVRCVCYAMLTFERREQSSVRKLVERAGDLFVGRGRDLVKWAERSSKVSLDEPVMVLDSV